jgi:hypothetical protein
LDVFKEDIFSAGNLLLWSSNLAKPDPANLSTEVEKVADHYSLTWKDFLDDILDSDISRRPHALALFKNSQSLLSGEEGSEPLTPNLEGNLAEGQILPHPSPNGLIGYISKFIKNEALGNSSGASAYSNLIGSRHQHRQF